MNCATTETKGWKVNCSPSVSKSQTVKLRSQSHSALQPICRWCLSFHMPTCRPRHCCLYQAGSSCKLCRNKTACTFMARFDLVLRTELCRLSNRRCGKTPPDNQVLFISSALSLNARWLLTGRGEAGAPSASIAVSQKGKWENWGRKWTPI